MSKCNFALHLGFVFLVGSLLGGCRPSAESPFHYSWVPPVAPSILPQSQMRALVQSLYHDDEGAPLPDAVYPGPPLFMTWEEFEQGATWPNPDVDSYWWCRDVSKAIREQVAFNYAEPVLATDAPFTAWQASRLAKLDDASIDAFASCGAMPLNLGVGANLLSPGNPSSVLVATADFRLYALDLPYDQQGLRFFIYGDRSFDVAKALELAGLAAQSVLAPWDIEYDSTKAMLYSQLLSGNGLDSGSFVGFAFFAEFDPWNCSFTARGFNDVAGYRSGITENKWQENRRLPWLLPRFSLNSIVEYQGVFAMLEISPSDEMLDSGPVRWIDWSFVDFDGDYLCQATDFLDLPD